MVTIKRILSAIQGLVLLGDVLYIVLPVDFIPDVIPLIGNLDDAAVTAISINTVAVLEARKQNLGDQEFDPRTMGLTDVFGNPLNLITGRRPTQMISTAT